MSPPNSFPEPLTEDITAESQEFSAEEELARAGEVIATTPVTTGNNKSVVDMQQGFQVCVSVIDLILNLIKNLYPRKFQE